MGVIPLLLCFGLSQFGYAQVQRQAQDSPQDDLAALRVEVEALRSEQKQIVTRLDELKQLLVPNGPPAAPVMSVDIHGETFRGDGDAYVVMIEYADFECPYCGEYERKAFPQVLSNYIETGKVKYVYRDLPLPMHTRALPAARAARCAGEQNKYWEMHDSLFAKQNALSAPALLERAHVLGLDTGKYDDCISSDKFTADIQKSTIEAQKMGIDGTPTFLLGIAAPDGRVNVVKRIQGAAPFNVFKSAIDELLAAQKEDAVSAR
jgi:protein-disulfide isomerase